jgi:hypothetical protein
MELRLWKMSVKDVNKERLLAKMYRGVFSPGISEDIQTPLFLLLCRPLTPRHPEEHSESGYLGYWLFPSGLSYEHLQFGGSRQLVEVAGKSCPVKISAAAVLVVQTHPVIDDGHRNQPLAGKRSLRKAESLASIPAYPGWSMEIISWPRPKREIRLRVSQ